MEIMMKELYRLIDSLDMNRKHELVTVTGGAHAGLKLLLTDGEVIWSSDPACSDIPEKARPESVFRERLTHAVRLVVCGCGYVGQSVIRLAKFLGWNVTALDDREEFVSMARLAGADEVMISSKARSVFIRERERTLDEIQQHLLCGRDKRAPV